MTCRCLIPLFLCLSAALDLEAQATTPNPGLKGDYLGQPPPGDTPVVFARGLVSGEYQEHCAPTFSPDGSEVFWQTNRIGRDQKWIQSHKRMRRVGGRWTGPEDSPYGGAPFFAPDGKRLYFDQDGLCFVEKQNNGWGEPKRLDLPARFPEVRHVYFPSIARNGNLYFMGYMEGRKLNLAIYRSEFRDGEYSRPEPLPSSINTPDDGSLNWTPYIAPDESYLIFCRRHFNPKDDFGDLYICFRQPDGGWTERINLGELINTKGLERFPAVSPDGKFLFFTRDTPDFDEDVYWVSAAVIEKLKMKAIREKRLHTSKMNH